MEFTDLAYDIEGMEGAWQVLISKSKLTWERNPGECPLPDFRPIWKMFFVVDRVFNDLI